MIQRFPIVSIGRYIALYLQWETFDLCLLIFFPQEKISKDISEDTSQITLHF